MNPNSSLANELGLSPLRTGNLRWTICTLVFFATTINYLDRQVISLVKIDLDEEFNWSKIDYANITIAFQITYALAMLVAGRIVEKLGSRWGYALFLFLWCLAAMGHGWITTTLGFIVARAILGLTESGNFPAAIKVITEWFPRKERAFATGFFNSGTNIGAIIAPLSVPFIASAMGWRWAFVITGAVGLIWLFFWFALYQVPAKHKSLSKVEYDHIHSDADEQREQSGQPAISWINLLRFRQTWAFAIGKFLTDGIWWFYLFWLPDFLNEQYGIAKQQAALPVTLVYVIAAVGSLGGGYLPLKLINNGWTVLRARRTSMFAFACCVLPVMLTQWLGSYNMWWAVVLIGLGAAAHQAWSANIYTTASDVFPKNSIASVTGIGGMAGGLGGILVSQAAGQLFQYYKDLGQIATGYQIMFFLSGSVYLLAWFLMRWLLGRNPSAINRNI